MVPVSLLDPLTEPGSYLGLAKVGCWILRQDFSFVWSAEMYDLFGLPQGCSREDIVGGYHPDDRNYITRSIARCFSSGQPLVTRYRIIRPCGELRQVFSRAVRRRAPDGYELIGVNVDVTEQIMDGNADVEEARRYRFIAENARDLILRYDPAGRLTFASPASRFVLGYSPDEMVGRNVASFLDPAAHPDARANLLARGKDGRGPGTIEIRALRADGRQIWLEGNPRPATNTFGEIIEWVDVVRDISDRKRTEAELVAAMQELAREKAAVEHGATHDYLTGLANRALFHQRLEEALANRVSAQAPFVVFAMDLDHFKAVNDTLGHAAGDSLLVQVATRLRRTLPDGCVIARLGGDEFAAILPNMRCAKDAVPVAHAVIAETSAHYVADGRPAVIGLSIGAADGDLGCAEAILRGADKALYRAKAQGRNAVCVHQEEESSFLKKRSKRLLPMGSL